MKVAILIYADCESGDESYSRVMNALEAAKEFKNAKDDIKVIFDGAGTLTAAAIANEDHSMNYLYLSVRDKIVGVCSFCAGAYEVRDPIRAVGMHLIAEYEQHPSIRTLVRDGYQIITF